MKKKTLVNKITMWLCALVLCVGMFGGTLEVRAAETTEDELNGFLLQNGATEFPYYNSEKKYIVTQDYSDGLDFLYVMAYDDNKFYIDSNGYLMTKRVSGAYSTYRYYFNSNSWRIYSEDQTYSSSYHCCTSYYKFNERPCVYINDAIYSDASCTTIAYSSYIKSAIRDTYLSTLGYLKNIGLKTLYVDGVQDMTYKFTFSPISTTGVDITSDDYVVRLYGQLAYYSTSTGVLSQRAENMVYVGDYDISNNSIQFGLQSVYDAVGAESELLDSWTMTSLGLVRADTLYLQLYNKTTGEYGGYVRFTNTSNTIGKGDTVTTITPDGETDNGGYTGEPVDGSVGSGGSIEDAEQDAEKEPVDIWQGFDSFSSILDGLSKTLGSVTGAFDTIFGFLPPYCRTLFGLSVSAILLIALVKFVRG